MFNPIHIKQKLFQMLSITLLFLYVSVQSPLHELVKLPSLVSHFIEHKNTNPNISFYDFIADHYGNHETSEDFNHNNLPFKDENHPLMIGFQYFNADSPALLPTSFSEVATISVCNTMSITMGEKSHVWQPPRV
jgi:hypothetical protein